MFVYIPVCEQVVAGKTYLIVETNIPVCVTLGGIEEVILGPIPI